MAIRLTWLVAVILSIQPLRAGEITLNGIYQGKNIFVRNPYIPQEKKFCISQIYVNEALLGNLPRTSAIQIDLSDLNLNEPVTIRIIHADNCTPVVVNPEVIQKARKFEFLFTQIDDNSINWITTGETPVGKFVLEKLKWEGWEQIMEINAKGQLDNNQYSIAASHYTGNNTYRLRYYNSDNEEFLSEEVSFYSLLEPIQMYPGDEVHDYISLSRDTDYEIYNEYDSLVMEGYGSEINVSALDYGEYYIILEDEPLRFSKPEPEIIPRKKRKKGDNRDDNNNNNNEEEDL